ncbi:MAG: hypothetical protein FWE67_05995 [Planctomycetaceae bacterium]|nr:hypothetical protein [Planctomycetaceae bacterium]
MKRRDILKAGIAASAGLGFAFAGRASANAETSVNAQITGREQLGRWTCESANAWYAAYPWIMGYNYVPSTAINQLEIWQADDFNAETIDTELAMAAAVGLNTARVFMHDIAWAIDPEGFKKRLDTFLALCEKHKTWALPTFFTNGGPGPHIEIKPGKQPESQQDVHNSAWLQSPGVAKVNDPKQWSKLEDYVTDVITAFAKDKRILLWCLYNEPENQRFGENTLPLMREVWKWARKVNPIHPLTAPYMGYPAVTERSSFPICCFLGENSDIISFHNYGKPEDVQRRIKLFSQFERPIICTEYMGRPVNTLFDIAPMLKEHRIGAIHFGLVNSKCNFHLPWRPKPEDLPEPKVWFHDIFRKDGSPYDPKEIELIKKLTGKTN